jgi:hypothetical protein
MIRVITCGKVFGATRRDSLLMAQAYLQPAILSELEEIYGQDAITLRAVEK